MSTGERKGLNSSVDYSACQDILGTAGRSYMESIAILLHLWLLNPGHMLCH